MLGKSAYNNRDQSTLTNNEQPKQLSVLSSQISDFILIAAQTWSTWPRFLSLHSGFHFCRKETNLKRTSTGRLTSFLSEVMLFLVFQSAQQAAASPRQPNFLTLPFSDLNHPKKSAEELGQKLHLRASFRLVQRKTTIGHLNIM